jgi:glucokinase
MWLGIDIGGTRIKAGLVDESGRLQATHAVTTPLSLDNFRHAIQQAAAAVAPPGIAVQAVGIGCKGLVHPRTTLVQILPGTLRFLEGHRLIELIGRDLPAAADNDARAAMAGEVVWGAARGCTNGLMLTLGTGVGGAILAEGKLLRGATGVAGHLGHTTVDADGVVCNCGNHGCLETVFSAPAIEGQAADCVRRGCETTLTANASCKEVFEAAAKGDAIARSIVSRGIHKLAGALAGMMLAFDPEVVILGGQITEAGPALFDPLREEVRWRTKRMLPAEVPLRPAQVTDGALGAAALAFLASRM